MDNTMKVLYIATILFLLAIAPDVANAQSYADRYYSQYNCDPWERCHNALANHHGGPDSLLDATKSLLGTIGVQPENGIYAQRYRHITYQSAPQARYAPAYAPQPQQYQPRQYVQPQPPVQHVYPQQAPTLQGMPVYEYKKPNPCQMVQTGYTKSNGEPVMAMADPAGCGTQSASVTLPQQPEAQQIVIHLNRDEFPAVEAEAEPEEVAAESGGWFGWGSLLWCLVPIALIAAGYRGMMELRRIGDARLGKAE